MWLKIIVACLPAAIIGLLFDDVFNALFYNYQTVAIMLILVGVLFIIIENQNKHAIPKVESIDDLDLQAGADYWNFPVSGGYLSGHVPFRRDDYRRPDDRRFPDRSGGIHLFPGDSGHVRRQSLETGKIRIYFTRDESLLLVNGLIVAFLVSIVAIKFLMSYIKKHDFKVFGWYRIVLGVIVLGYFGVKTFL